MTFARFGLDSWFAHSGGYAGFALPHLVLWTRAGQRALTHHRAPLVYLVAHPRSSVLPRLFCLHALWRLDSMVCAHILHGRPSAWRNATLACRYTLPDIHAFMPGPAPLCWFVAPFSAALHMRFLWTSPCAGHCWVAFALLFSAPTPLIATPARFAGSRCTIFMPLTRDRTHSRVALTCWRGAGLVTLSRCHALAGLNLDAWFRTFASDGALVGQLS